VVAQRNICSEKVFGGPAINTHGTHVAFWQTLSGGKSQTLTTTDWRELFPELRLVVDFLLSRELLDRVIPKMTVESIAEHTGSSVDYVKQRKAALETIAAQYGVPAQVWTIDELQARRSGDWRINILYDAAAKSWQYGTITEEARYALVVMSLDSTNARKETLLYCGRDITSVAPLSGFHDGVGSVEWPQGDWIYFTTTKEVKYLYRVNVKTKALEKVAAFNCFVKGENREFKLSADGATMLVNRLGKAFKLAAVSDNGMVDDALWSKGGSALLGGCGHTLSPSGNRVGFQTDAGHIVYNIMELDWQKRSSAVIAETTPEQRNQWSLQRNHPQLACESKPDYIESVGTGQATEGMSFAVNSDEWVCLISGWFPRGRFGNNGMNFVLMNQAAQVTLNVSQNLRFNDSRYPVPSACAVTSSNVSVDDVEFVLTGPREQVLPSLRADMGVAYSVPGVDGPSVVAAVDMAQSPFTGVQDGYLKLNRAHGPGGAPIQVGRGVVMSSAGGALNLRSVVPMVAVALFSLNGQQLLRVSAQGSSELTLGSAQLKTVKGYRVLQLALQDGSHYSSGVLVR
jgi:hypothetical protein